MKSKLTLLGSIIITLFVGSFLANYLHSYSTFFMPEEYKTIKKLVNKLASSNHLGGSAIPFNISKKLDYESFSINNYYFICRIFFSELLTLIFNFVYAGRV